MTFINTLIILLTGILFAIGVNPKVSRTPFNLSKPSLRVKLSDKLKEISGLTWYKRNLLAAIQDEDGRIFLINSSTGIIERKLKFAGPGDYESIVFTNGFFYVITSSGLLYQVNHLDPTQLRKFKTPLNWMNDVEGMCYDTVLDVLLVACKEQASTKLTPSTKGKAIYGLDINNQEFVTPAIYTIKKKELVPFLKSKRTFKPSGLAIDPITCNLYVLASVGKMLIVMSPDGTILDVNKLSSKQFRQPEGIAFSPEGDLYVASEAKGKKAVLLKFIRKIE